MLNLSYDKTELNLKFERAFIQYWRISEAHQLRHVVIETVPHIRELTILGRERRPRLHKTKTAITEIKALQLCRKHNLKDLFI